MIVADCFSFFTNIITFRACLCYWFWGDFSRLRETIRENFLHVLKQKWFFSSCIFLILCQDFLIIFCNFKMLFCRMSASRSGMHSFLQEYSYCLRH